MHEAELRPALFIDFGLQRDPAMVPATLTSMLGISVTYDDPTPYLMTFLRDNRMLLIFDNCEHIIEAVAALAAGILRAAPHVHVLGTSREAFKVAGEQIYRLAPLPVPPEIPDITASIARSSPAVQLFIERATASGARLDLSDAEVTIIAGICGKLDGLALAIELAAGRVAAYGLQRTLHCSASGLPCPGKAIVPHHPDKGRCRLQWTGASIFSEPERVVLLRLSVFVGPFDIDAALDVVAGPNIDDMAFFSTIDGLVAKSMIAARPLGATMQYQLLDTTRTYLLKTAAADPELVDLPARHANHYHRWLGRIRMEWPDQPTMDDRLQYLRGLNNVLAALEWCFEAEGNGRLGVALAAAAAPAFFAMSLLSECQHRSQSAIVALEGSTRGARTEMRLQAALGLEPFFAGA
jgi:predicted ATPase